MARRGLGHAQVVQVASGQPLGIAEGEQRQDEMRVVHVAPTAFGAGGIFGGGERYPVELARALARHVDCELVTFAGTPGVVREAGGLTVRTLRPVAHLGHPAHPLAVGLPRALASADVIHAHHMRSAPSRMAALVAAARRRPAVVTDHGLAGGTWGGLLPRLFDRFLTVSEHSARELGAPRSRTRVVYGGVDGARYRPDPAVVRRSVLFVGRLTPHKGIDRLIRALPPGASLTIAGSAGHDPAPPERDYPQLLRRLAAGRDVRFLGPVPDDALPALLRSAAVLALPSVHWTCFGRFVPVSELLGLVVLEAMASGTPVVCSRIGGVPEIVADGVTGFLVAPGDVDALRERLATLLADHALAARVGRQAREHALARFTWDACAARCLSAYAEVGAR
jgi:glycosyltransferase involved in cell wall biosynthesis